MTTYEMIEQANKTLKLTPIKGKDYAEVNQRIKAFRMVYPHGTISTEMLSNENGVCVFKATVLDEGTVIGTGTAFERQDGSYINKTSYIENCETSAVGRALGMCGFGIDTALASADEVKNAVEQQNGQTTVICPNCNKEIKAVKKKNGTIVTPEKILESCGGMCAACYKKAKEEKSKQDNSDIEEVG